MTIAPNLIMHGYRVVWGEKKGSDCLELWITVRSLSV